MYKITKKNLLLISNNSKVFNFAKKIFFYQESEDIRREYAILYLRLQDLVQSKEERIRILESELEQVYFFTFFSFLMENFICNTFR